MNDILSDLNSTQKVFLTILLLALVVQLVYILLVYLRIVLFKAPPIPTEQKPISVVICARNESEKLMKHIPIIMDQAYTDFEVVVVNDSSWDDSEDILKALQVQFSKLKVLTLNEDLHKITGKKFALTMGIKAASNERLLLTDADCVPLSDQWLSEINSTFSDQKEITLGISLLKKGKGLLKRIFRYESFHTAVNYTSSALIGMPYMGVGRNLSYSSSLFFSVGGFKSHMHIKSGDDDLFINQVSNAKNTAVIMSTDSQTESESKNTFKEWWAQKRRHLSTSGHYKTKYKLLLALEPLSWWGLWLSVGVLLILRTNMLLVIVPLALRYLTVYGTFIAIGRKWQALDNVWVFPLWEALLNVVKPLVLLSNAISKPKQWM